MAPLAERVGQAASIARHPRLQVLALETRLGTRYTADTLRRLATWPGHRFVWLMGADNLAQLPRWRHWRAILAACPVAVFERHPYSYAAMSGPVARGLRVCPAAGAAGRGAGQAARRRPGCSCGCARTRPPPRQSALVRNRPDSRRPRGDRDHFRARTRPAPRRNPRRQPSALLELVTASLDDDKAIDPAVIDLAGKTTLAEFMVVATGTSQRHIASMAEQAGRAAEGSRASTMSRPRGSRMRPATWILIDAGDVLVHLFRAETRSFYDIEKLWSVAPPRRAAAEAGAATP